MATHRALLSLGFSRQEHWSGLPFLPPMHESESEVAQLCLTLSNPMDCSLPGSSVHGIFFSSVQFCSVAQSCPTLCDPVNHSMPVETVSDFIFWGSKITADGDCGREIKRHLLLGRKVMTNLDSILKSRDITLPTKVHLVKAMVFPVVMYRCESWTVKKAEHRRIDAFEVWCWRRLLRVPWTARRSNQSILKETSPGCSLEELMLRLKLQYFGHLI